MQPLPRILCIGGHDPTGGAGIQADIETVGALGGRALTLITCATVQDTHNVTAVTPIDAQLFTRQADTLMADIRPDAIKIGLIGSSGLIAPIAALLRAFDGPVVLDPVLAAGGGFDFDRAHLTDATMQLLPNVTLITPNRAELRRLAPNASEPKAADTLLGRGVQAVLLTGADEARGEQVSNLLYRPEKPPKTWHWPRLPQRYHGSGCTLAAACATCLAHGDPVERAVERAQRFTWQALQRADAVGHGQWLPRRRGDP